MAQFREMVGWEERGNGGNGASNHASGDMSTLNGSGGGVGQIIKPNKVDLNIRYGPSYRRLPPSVSILVLSEYLPLNLFPRRRKSFVLAAMHFVIQS